MTSRRTSRRLRPNSATDRAYKNAARVLTLAMVWAKTGQVDRAKMRLAVDAARASQRDLAIGSHYQADPDYAAQDAGRRAGEIADIGSDILKGNAQAALRLDFAIQTLPEAEAASVKAQVARLSAKDMDATQRRAADAASKFYVLAKRWSDTGRIDRSELKTALDTALAAASDIFDDESTSEIAAAAAKTEDVAVSIFQGHDAEARRELAQLRDMLSDLVNVPVLEAQAKMARNFRRRTSRRFR